MALSRPQNRFDFGLALNLTATVRLSYFSLPGLTINLPFVGGYDVCANQRNPYRQRGLPEECPDTCAFLYHVEDGKLVEVTGDPDHPMTRGGLCVKLKDYAEHHYHPDRLLYAMKRVGPKGSGQFERITYDEALAEIKKRWTQIIDQYGSQAIINHCYLGDQGTLNGLTSGDAFFNRLGATIGEKCYCKSGSSTAWIMTVGPTGGLDVESLAHSKYIIVWAMNMLSTNLHAWPFILKARKKVPRSWSSTRSELALPSRRTGISRSGRGRTEPWRLA